MDPVLDGIIYYIDDNKHTVSISATDAGDYDLSLLNLCQMMDTVYPPSLLLSPSLRYMRSLLRLPWALQNIDLLSFLGLLSTSHAFVQSASGRVHRSVPLIGPPRMAKGAWGQATMPPPCHHATTPPITPPPHHPYHPSHRPHHITSPPSPPITPPHQHHHYHRVPVTSPPATLSPPHRQSIHGRP